MHNAHQQNIPENNTDKPLTRLEQLVMLEADALEAQDQRSLRHLITNNTRKLIAYGHCFVFIKNDFRDLKAKPWITKTISGQGVIDRTSPFIRWMESCVHDNIKIDNGGKTPGTFIPHLFTLKDQPSSEPAMTYPYQYGLWIKLAPDMALFFTREKKWQQDDIHILNRISKFYANRWIALSASTKIKNSHPMRRRVFQASTALALLVLIWPISMSTLAPAEIIAAEPQIVTAPINGVIKDFNFAPNSYVQKGDVIATYEDTTLRNELALSADQSRIAKARLDTNRRVSINDEASKRDLKSLESELGLAQSRYVYAGEQLSRTKLIANTNGLLIYSDRDEWRGRPVSVGERIATIADTNNVELKIEAPVGDGELLIPGARVKLFLDSKPIDSIQAKLQYAAFFAEPTPSGTLAYRAKADITDAYIPRIGARGVAKIYGKRAPLGYWLLRKPIVSIRQFIGL